jgi:zinc/manganese transport system substrate-binding protein
MRILFTIIFSLWMTSTSSAAIKVVTSFSILADIVKQIGGEHVQIDNIVGANEDAHVFNPAPQHSIMLANADLVIINGLGFEGWIERLIKASGFKRTVVVASAHIKSLTAGNVEDPHFWHSIPAMMKCVDTISKAMQKADPANAKMYQKNATSYNQR